MTSSNEGVAGTVGLLTLGQVHCESRREQASEAGLRYHTKVSEWLSGWTGWNDGNDVVLVPLPLLTQRNHSNPSQQVPRTQRWICPSILETRANMTTHQTGRISLLRLALALAADLDSSGQPSISRDGTTGHCPLPRESPTPQRRRRRGRVHASQPIPPMLVPAQRDRRAWRPRKDPPSRRHISDLAEPSRSSDGAA